MNTVKFMVGVPGSLVGERFAHHHQEGHRVFHSACPRSHLPNRARLLIVRRPALSGSVRGDDIHAFAIVLLVIAIVGIGAVLSNRLGEWLPIPAPALFLVGAAAASDIWPRLEAVPSSMVERGVTLALVVILFDGGMQIGWRKFRDAAAPIVWTGVLGTLATAGLLTLAVHGIFRLGWRIALLLGTALSPTDPAVVFSVLGRRRIEGRSAVLLQGESAANDPVGIALLVAILAAPHLIPARSPRRWEPSRCNCSSAPSAALLPGWGCCGSCGGCRYRLRGCTRCACCCR